MTNHYAPPIYVDETIYSYVARLHLYFSETNHRNSARRWFGKSPINIDQRLPIGLKLLSENSGVSLRDLLHQNTYYPIFAAFSSQPQSLKTAMLSNDGRNIANVSNVAQAGLKQLSQFKYCPECIKSDKQKYGVAFWHLSHQMHGVTSCLQHATKLCNAPQLHRVFQLPPQIVFKPIAKASQQDMNLTAFIMKACSDYASGYCRNRADFEKEPIALVQQKSLFKGQSVDMSMVMDIVTKLSIEHFGESILSEVVVFNLLHKPNYHCHPFKAIFLAYAIEQMPYKAVKVKKELCDERVKLEKDRKRCIQLLGTGEYSLREVARRLNRSVNFVKSVACHIGTHFQKRTQFITADVEERILHLASQGMHREKIAAQEGVSVGAVEILIQSVPGLSYKRRQILKQSRQIRARRAIQDALSINPPLTRSKLRSTVYADYSWLYRHDKAWLYKHLPAAQKTKRA